MIVMVVTVSVEKSGESHKGNFTEHITIGGEGENLSYNWRYIL